MTLMGESHWVLNIIAATSATRIPICQLQITKLLDLGIWIPDSYSFYWRASFSKAEQVTLALDLTQIMS